MLLGGCSRPSLPAWVRVLYGGTGLSAQKSLAQHFAFCPVHAPLLPGLRSANSFLILQAQEITQHREPHKRPAIQHLTAAGKTTPGSHSPQHTPPNLLTHAHTRFAPADSHVSIDTTPGISGGGTGFSGFHESSGRAKGAPARRCGGSNSESGARVDHRGHRSEFGRIHRFDVSLRCRCRCSPHLVSWRVLSAWLLQKRRSNLNSLTLPLSAVVGLG